MRRTMDFVEHVVGACAALLLLLFTVLILFDIVCRYWLHIPLSWPTELTVLLFQWTAFSAQRSRCAGEAISALAC